MIKDNQRNFKLDTVPDVVDFFPNKNSMYIDEFRNEYDGALPYECIHNSSYPYENFIGYLKEVY